MVHKIHKTNIQNHVGNHRAIRKLQGNEKQHRGSQNNWITSGNLKFKESINFGFKPDAEDQEVQQWIASVHRRLKQYGRSSSLRKFFQTEMFDLNAYWESREIYCSCGRNNEVYAESNRVRPEQPWHHFNPWIKRNSNRGVKHEPSEK